MQINHATNPDNIYWGHKRFTPPVSWLHKVLSPHSQFSGDNAETAHFWGDLAKQHIRYMRNLTFDVANTTARDPRMPYLVKSKSQFSNLWFSASDGENAEEFTNLLSPRNLDQLERDGGTCIVYTHFSAGFVERGEVIPSVKNCLEDVASRAGWFAPASKILDHLRLTRGSDVEVDYWYCLTRDLLWTFDRIKKGLRSERRRRTLAGRPGVFPSGDRRPLDLPLSPQGG